MTERTYDVAIVGAGVTGAAIARRLAFGALSVVLIDAKEDVAMGASRANSAIVHAGYDCPGGSLMARLNVEGNRLFTEWCEQLEVPLVRCGSLVIAFNDDEERELVNLYKRGVAAGVPGLEIVMGERARQIEPKLNEDVTAALWAPSAGITCPYQLTIGCAENARDNGAEWMLGAPVESVSRADGALLIRAGGRDVRARYLVNAAGVYADELARMLGDDSFGIRPRKGEYLLLDKAAAEVGTVVFQTPSKLGKGVLVSPTVDGNCFAGPTAVDGTRKDDTEVSQAGIDELSRLAKKSVPDLNLRQVITSFAGVRAQPSTSDFIIRQSGVEPRLIHAAGICSPGLTAAPAIAEEIAGILARLGEDVSPRPDHQPRRRAIREFRHMGEAERRAAIRENPLYGRVICRCETVTEAEIVEAIRRGARNVDGVKCRTRAGMGRCQGGFCGPRVMDILSRELGVPMEELTKSGGGSWLVEAMWDE